jgi:CubicO group peptidase (beta-lactamase class C family)
LSIPIEGFCDSRFSRVRDAFAEALTANGEVGAAIAFTLDGECVVDLWGGHADAQRTRPWQRDTLVNTYSTTKGMTAICAHQLVERGKIDLDARVAQYWPEFAQAGKEEITFRWLISHQAGLPAIRKPLPEETLFDWDAMVAELAAESPWWEPGTRHGYHPVTFGHLVGEVIRRVSGQSVGQWFRNHVTGPLDADFHIGLPESEDQRVSDMIGSIVAPRIKTKAETEPGKSVARIKGPMADFMRDMTDPTTMVGAAFNNPRQPRDLVNRRAWRGAEIPAANGHGTAHALARIYGALARGGEVDGVRILEPESIDRARSSQASGPDAVLAGMSVDYGLGFMLRSQSMPLSPNEGAFGHPGAGGSFGMADPTARVGFGYVMNKIKPGLMGGRTGYSAIDAFYSAL